jgi:hypothetical protein
MNARNGVEQPDSPFATFACEQLRVVDQLLAASGVPLVWLRRGARKKRFADVRRGISRDITDPEFKKNLQILRQLILGAIGVWQRAEARETGGSRTDPTQGSVNVAADTGVGAEPHPTPSELAQLRERIAIPLKDPITLETLLGHRFQLDRFLIRIGDSPYLSGRAAELYKEEKGTSPTWRDLYRTCPPIIDDVDDVTDQQRNADIERHGDQRPDSVSQAGGRGEGERLEITRRMLGRLLAEKEALGLPTRARRELKRRALFVVLPILVIATASFAVALGAAGSDWWGLLLAAAAGATGASIGGLLRLRNELRLGAQIREFSPFFVGQAIVGAAAGLFVFAINDAGLVQVNGGLTGTAAFAFVIGFSEAAFLGLITRIGGST